MGWIAPTVSLALTGLHLGDAALAEHDAADELHVEGTGAEGRPTHRVKFSNRLVDPIGDVDEEPRGDRDLRTEQVTFGWGGLGGIHRGEGLIKEPTSILRQRVRIESGIRVEDVPDADRSVHRLPGDREDLGNQPVSIFSLGDPLPKFDRRVTEFGVGELTRGLFSIVDRVDLVEKTTDLTLITSAEELLGSPAEERNAHGRVLSGVAPNPPRGGFRCWSTRPAGAGDDDMTDLD